MKQLLGHDGPPQSFWRENLATGVELLECPLRTVIRARETSPEVAEQVARDIDVYFPAYRDGHLLTGGGIADQPARYVESMMLIRDMWNAIDAKDVEIASQGADEA